MSLHTLFLDIEASKGNGEDSHLIYDDDCFPFVVLGAFDGLGGRSAGFEGMTGGRIASKEATKITKMVLEERQGMLNQDIATKLQDRICQSLKSQAESKMVKSRLSGTLTGKRLCTTIALASIPRQIELESSPCEISLAWMGDSRIYFLSPQNGLQQLTRDDLEVDKDAFEMIREDPPMSQYLTADIPSNWAINFLVKNIEEKGCILVCTDGCFQYLPAPWELEKLLLKALMTAASFEEWQTLLSQKYEEIKQDDISLILHSLSFSSFEVLKTSYQDRLKYLDKNYNYEASENTLSELWKKYRDNYEARLNPRVSKKGIIKNIPSSLENCVDKPDSSESSRLQQVESLLTQASRYDMFNKFPEAVQLYQQVLQWDPKNQKALIGMGIAFNKLNSYEQSVIYFEEAKKTQQLEEEPYKIYKDSLQQIDIVQNEERDLQ
jgi:serine/threonine protein phosphatase PrpC